MQYKFVDTQVRHVHVSMVYMYCKASLHSFFLSALGTGATGSLFGAQNKPQTGFNFGSGTTGLGTSAFNAASNTPGGLFGAKPTAFGATAFGTNTGTGLFGATGTLGTATGLNTGTLGTG